MATQSFVEKYSFTTYLDCSDLFHHLYAIADGRTELTIKSIPPQFEEFVEQMNQVESVKDKIYNFFDSIYTDIETEMTLEEIRNTIEYSYGGDLSNSYISDWDYSPKFQELIEKQNFVNKILDTMYA
jgi:hypothetical protein